MPAATATIVNLAEYRQRRFGERAAAAAPAAASPLMWYPVWFMVPVPVWPVPQSQLGGQTLTG